MMNFRLLGILFVYLLLKIPIFDFAFHSAVQNSNPNSIVFLDHLSSTHTVI